MPTRRLLLRVSSILFLTGGAATAADGDGQALLRFIDLAGKPVEGEEIQVPTDTRGTWEIEYIVGPGGMAKDGGIWIKRLGWWDFHFGFMMQDDDPTGADYVTCRTTSTTGKVALDSQRLARFFKEMNMLHAVVTDGALREGDRIILTVGDRSQGGKGAVTAFVAWPDRKIFIQSDTDGDGEYGTLPRTCLVSFLPKPATHYVVVAPSVVTVGETFVVQLRAEDANSNLDPTYERLPRLTNESMGGRVTPLYVFARPVARDGMFRLNFRGEEPGVSYLRFHGEDGLTGRSNPIRVVAPDDATERLYWGDTHIHTYESDGTDSLDDNYRYARDVAHLDFACMSDHLHPTPQGARQVAVRPKAVANGLWRPISNDIWWKLMLDSADRHHDPAKFVTFYAYEWSGGSQIGGDHIPILTERRELPAPHELNDLYRILEDLDRGNNVMIIPHVGGRIGNWDWHSPQVEIAAEVASVHGHFEWFGQEALQRGYKVAFMGAGDNHYGRPGWSNWARFGRMKFKERNYGVPQPITGAYAKELTRTGIVEAFRRRHVFATTGHRPLVQFTLNATRMGGELTTDAAPTLRADIWGTAEIDRIDVIRNQHRLHTQEADTLHATFELTDRTLAPGHNAYYLRITQRDGEIAWSSPVFVQYTGPDDHAAEREKLPAWNDDGTVEEWIKRRRERNRPSAEEHKSTLRALLDERAPDRFGPLHAVEWIENPRGSYALFFATDGETEDRPTRIRYYPGFTEPRLHLYPGLGDYGPIRH